MRQPVPSSPGSATVLAGPWRRLATKADDTVHVQHGPGQLDEASLVRWLGAGCVGRALVRQGFVAVLARADGSVLAAGSSRREVAVLFAVERGRLVLATHPHDLISAMATPPEIDVAKMADLMALWDDRSTTVFRGVGRLPVGHALEWRPGQPQPRTWRWFRPEEAAPLRIDPRAAPDAMRVAVRGAVEASLPASGDVAATLSGGLDSSTVVATAAAALAPTGRWVHTMTHVPLDGTPDPNELWEADDWPYVERMVREVPGLTGRRLVNTGLVSPLRAAEASYDRTWSPVRNPPTMVWLGRALDLAEQEGHTLLLTGATGNGPFSRGGDGVLREMWHQRQLVGIARQAAQRHAAGERWGAVAHGMAGQLAPRRLLGLRARARSGRDADSSFAARMPLLPDSLSERARDQLARWGLPSAEVDLHDEWLRLVQRDASLSLFGQAWSRDVWWSDPLSDPEVVSLALRLPPEAWISGGTDRALARSAVRGLVPDHIRVRRTRGGQAIDVPRWLADDGDYHRDALERLRASTTVGQYIDVETLAGSLAGGLPTGEAARAWQRTHGRAMALGLFTVWYEQVRRDLMVAGPSESAPA